MKAVLAIILGLLCGTSAGIGFFIIPKFPKYAKQLLIVQVLLFAIAIVAIFGLLSLIEHE
jgi:ABC-type nitrate/sulfonate/bicarbonate transport system permease component